MIEQIIPAVYKNDCSCIRNVTISVSTADMKEVESVN